MPTLEKHGAELHDDDVANGPETIVLIHGPMPACASRAAQRDAFCHRCRVINRDLRGQGISTKTPERLHLDSLAEDTVAFGPNQRLGCFSQRAGVAA